jgi:WD40 repeat protein
MIALHDVVQDYLAQRLGDRLFTSHNRLVEAYALDCQHGADGALRWSTGPDDGYYFQRLVYHLAEAGREEEQNDLLLDLDWLQIKLKNTDVNALLTDYDVALSRSEDEALQLVQAAIRLSAHVLNRDKTQLWSQLYGRLMAHDLPDIQEMLENSPRKPWLRTLVPSLRHAGGALVRTLPDPGEEVKAVAVTPDGDRAILISKDRSSDEILDETPKVWNLECGAPSTPSEAYSEVNAVAVTPDGRLMVVALSDGTLRLLDISDKGLEHEIDIFQGHTAPVWAVGMTKVRDERCAVSASGDRTLKVWSLESHKEIGEGLEGHEGAVWDVAVTPDGQCAVSASGDGTLRVWDLEQQENRCILEGHQESVWAVAVTSDGRRAVSGAEDGTLRMWDLEAESELWKLPTSAPIKAVVMTSDGRYAVSISENGVLEAWDLKREANVCTLESRTPITALAATRDGRCVVSADDKALRIWEISDENLDSDLELPSLEYHIEDVSAVALTGDGGRAISASEDALSVWDIPDVGLKTGSTPWVLEDYGEPVSAVAVTPDGKRAISGATDGSLKVWDIANVGLGQVRTLHALKGHTLGDSPKKGINAVIAMPDDRRAISASSDETLKVWDLEHGIELCTLEGHKGSVTAVAVTLDGKRAVSASSDRRLKIWDIESGMMSYTLEGHEGFVEAVAVTPDGRCAVSASRDQTLKVWDLERGEEICTLDGHDDEVGDVAITPDGHQVISASHDTTLKVWDLERGKELHTLEGHTAWVEAVEVTEDGRYAVSVSRYGTLKVWKLESGKIIATFTAGTGDALLDCAVARDSRTIVAGGRSGQVHILRLEGADGHEI